MPGRKRCCCRKNIPPATSRSGDDFPRDLPTRCGACRRASRRTTVKRARPHRLRRSGAFIGSIRLKDCHGVMRRRIGEYRLLYRLALERVQVIDLIPRCDLERRIKMFIGS